MLDISGPPRCIHHLMLFGDELLTGISLNCGLCNPAMYTGDKLAAKNFQMPEIGHAPEKLRANKTSPGYCPKCREGFHTVEDDGRWKCSECGDVYKAPARKADLGTEMAEVAA